MKAGEVIKSFKARNGSHVVLRTPRWEDLDDLLDFINSLVDEKADIARAEKVSREAEIEWLTEALDQLERDETFHMVAEVNGKVIGNSEIRRWRRGYERHVGFVGVALRNGFRDVGIGTAMMKTLIEYAKKSGLIVLVLQVFATNERAIHVYEKVGFVKTGTIPKKFFKDGQFIDEITMTKILE